MQRGPRPLCRIVSLAALVVTALLTAASPAEACTIWTTSGQVELHFNPDAPVPYWVQADGSADVDFASLKDAIFGAFDQWSSVTCGDQAPQLAFSFVDDLDQDPLNYDPRLFRDEKNMVAFINEGWEGDPLVLARARILWNEDTGEIVEFGIALNDQYVDWTTDPEGEPEKYDVQSVLARQIGLVMGLGDSEVEGAVMFPAIASGDTSRRALSNDDALAICDLYAPGRASWDGPPAELVCTRDLHPGARPAGNNVNNSANNSANNSSNNSSNNGENNDANNETPPGGVGASCMDASGCREGLECGCPPALGSCEQDVCFEPAAPEPAPTSGAADDDGCAVAPQAGAAPSLLGLLAALGVTLWGLRRRV